MGLTNVAVLCGVCVANVANVSREIVWDRFPRLWVCEAVWHWRTQIFAAGQVSTLRICHLPLWLQSALIVLVVVAIRIRLNVCEVGLGSFPASWYVNVGHWKGDLIMNAGVFQCQNTCATSTIHACGGNPWRAGITLVMGSFPARPIKHRVWGNVT